MKKLGIFFLVMGLITVFITPVSAITFEHATLGKLTVGGIVWGEVGYWSRSKEIIGGAGNTTLSDRNELLLNTGIGSRLNIRVENGPIGVFYELGLGSDLLKPDGSYANFISTRHVYGYYNFGDCQILFGKTHDYFSEVAVSPWQWFGTDEGHVGLFGWGAVYDYRISQIRFTQNISKQVRYQISLVQPSEKVDAGASTTNPNSLATIPAVAAKLSLNFGSVALFPAFIYQNYKWDNVKSGADDNVTAWMGLLPVKFTVGAFTGLVQVGYGQNNGNLPGGVYMGQATYVRNSGGKVHNTTGLSGFVDLAYTFGKVTPHLFFGYDNAKNSDAWTKGNDNVTRTGYGASLVYKLRNNIIIVPEISFYDYGQTPGDAAKPNKGKEWLGGVEVVFVF